MSWARASLLWRVNEVHSVHEREIGSITPILGELIGIELGKRLSEPALERVGDRASVLAGL